MSGYVLLKIIYRNHRRLLPGVLMCHGFDTAVARPCLVIVGQKPVGAGQQVVTRGGQCEKCRCPLMGSSLPADVGIVRSAQRRTCPVCKATPKRKHRGLHARGVVARPRRVKSTARDAPDCGHMKPRALPSLRNVPVANASRRSRGRPLAALGWCDTKFSTAETDAPEVGLDAIEGIQTWQLLIERVDAPVHARISSNLRSLVQRLVTFKGLTKTIVSRSSFRLAALAASR
jgi:hypothetical protein